MKNMEQINAARQRRVRRVRAKINGTTECPRLAVSRTIKHIYAQVIDDVTRKTIVAASDSEIKADKMKKTEIAFALGKLIAEKAKSKKVTIVVFDRRDKRYHGRVKAVAEGAREGGLDF